MSAPGEIPGRGLRERNKAKTRARIQHEALALFRTHGYAATTVEQIAAAAEVSESTFFRYFSTKEAVVITDDFDPLVAAAFRAQPADIGPVEAIRRAFHAVAENLAADELNDLRERSVMIFHVPDLWAASLVQLTDTMQMMAELIAERVGRASDDWQVRALAGAAVGVMISLMPRWTEDPDLDVLASIDDALAFLDAGLPIARNTGSQRRGRQMRSS
jgi:AcrR family transcriptional regulator